MRSSLTLTTSRPGWTAISHLAQFGHDLRRQLETEVHPLGADVEEDVPRRGDRVVAASDFAERVEVGRARRPEKPVPRIGPEPEDAGQLAFDVAKPDCAQERGKIGTERAHRRASLAPWIDSHNEEDRRARKRGHDRLWNGA